MPVRTVPASTRERPAAGVSAEGRPATPGAPGLLAFLRSVRWTPSYVGFVLYTMVITTYTVPLGDVAIAMALGGLLVEHKRIRIEAPLRWFAAFLAWCALGIALTRYPEIAWQRTYLMAKLWIITLVAMTVLDSRPRLQMYCVLFLLFFATFPARGAIFNYVVHGYNYEGRALWEREFGNPNQLAALTLLQLSLAIGALVTERVKLIRMGALASLVVLPIVILMTQSRGVFVALVAFTGIVLARHPKRGKLLLALSVVAVIAVFAAPQGVWKRVGGLTKIRGTENLRDADSSAEERWLIWQVSFRVAADFPIAGTGIGSSGRYLQMYEPRLGGQKDNHSTYVNVLVETGIIGLGIFAGLMGAVLLRTRKVLRLLATRPSPQAQQLLFAYAGLAGFLIAAIWGTFTGLQLFYLQLAIVWSMTTLTLSELRQSGASTAPADPARSSRSKER